MVYDAIIVGAGACGLMCAVQAGFLGKKVLLIESNDKPGAKILISGGGRCNYTNLWASAEQYISKNQHFVKSAFAQWTVGDTLQFFERYGIAGAEKTLGQLFPQQKKAKDIVAVFTDLCADMGQEILCNAHLVSVLNEAEIYQVELMHFNNSKHYKAKSLVMCTGGLPIPKMGASDFALRFARQHQLNIVETAPALVPLSITGKELTWVAQLSGNSVFCRVSNERASFEENILFTHWGLSGPAILQISSYWRPGETLEIDMLPNIDIQEYLLAERQHQGNLLLSTILCRFYSKKITEALSKFLPTDKVIADLRKEDLQKISLCIHHFKVRPAGDKGYDKAEVMRGGIDTNELSSKTLESKKIPRCYFGGECVDVTGWLGGYNFQWAWASAYVIAQNI